MALSAVMSPLIAMPALGMMIPGKSANRLEPIPRKSQPTSIKANGLSNMPYKHVQ